jgi:glycine/D-amino acid oxidase-like deaminating enzyme
MQLNSGKLYWKDKSKINKIYPYLSHDIAADVIVIGGGIAGALTTYFLAKEGANVVVVEKNIIGHGNTIADIAMLEYQLESQMNKLEKNIGKNGANRIYKLCLDAISTIEGINKEFKTQTGFARQDNIYFTNKFMQRGTISKEYEERKNAGFDAVYIDSHSLLNLNGGIVTKSASAVLNPYTFTQGLFEYLEEMDNVKIFENTKVEDIKCGIDNVECKTNNNFKITADKLIFASGIETLKYVNDTPAELYKTFTIVTKPIEKLKNFNTNFTARDSLEPSHSLRFAPNNRIIYSGEEVKFTDKLMDKKYLNNVSSDKYKKLFSSLQKTLYNIENIPIEFAFNSTVGNTRDGLPIIDEISNMQNCFCNLAFGSNGILYSAIGADMLRNAIKGLYTKDMNMFRINR